MSSSIPRSLPWWSPLMTHSGHLTKASLDSYRTISLARLCGFLGVPPPDSGKSCSAVFRHRIGMAEAIPSRCSHFVIVPLRNDVVVPQQNAIERSGSRLEIGALLGEDNLDRKSTRLNSSHS